MKVGLFTTRLSDSLFPNLLRSTVDLLERLGCEVVCPERQSCCGQMHVNAGYLDEAVPLVRQHVEVFSAAGCDAVVAPSGSCVASVRHQHVLVARRANNVGLEQRAKALAARTFELSEFLFDELGVTDVGAFYPHRVTYHPTCHSLRLLRVADKPLSLLREVRGIDLVTLPVPPLVVASAERSRLRHVVGAAVRDPDVPADGMRSSQPRPQTPLATEQAVARLETGSAPDAPIGRVRRRCRGCRSAQHVLLGSHISTKTRTGIFTVLALS